MTTITFEDIKIKAKLKHFFDLTHKETFLYAGSIYVKTDDNTARDLATMEIKILNFHPSTKVTLVNITEIKYALIREN